MCTNSCPLCPGSGFILPKKYRNLLSEKSVEQFNYSAKYCLDAGANIDAPQILNSINTDGSIAFAFKLGTPPVIGTILSTKYAHTNGQLTPIASQIFDPLFELGNATGIGNLSSSHVVTIEKSVIRNNIRVRLYSIDSYPTPIAEKVIAVDPTDTDPGSTNINSISQDGRYIAFSIRNFVVLLEHVDGELIEIDRAPNGALSNGANAFIFPDGCQCNGCFNPRVFVAVSSISETFTDARFKIYELINDSLELIVNIQTANLATKISVLPRKKDVLISFGTRRAVPQVLECKTPYIAGAGSTNSSSNGEISNYKIYQFDGKVLRELFADYSNTGIDAAIIHPSGKHIAITQRYTDISPLVFGDITHEGCKLQVKISEVPEAVTAFSLGANYSLDGNWFIVSGAGSQIIQDFQVFKVKPIRL